MPSDANFVLFQVPGDQRRIWKALLEQGVLVRDVGLAGWLRVTAGTPGEMDAFLSELGSLMKAAGSRTSIGDWGSVTRSARVERTTKESSVLVELELDGTGQAESETGVPFFDHMVAQLGQARRVQPEGGDHRRSGRRHPPHRRGHLTGDRHGAAGRRSATSPGSAASATRLVPLDEALVSAAVDLSGRPYCVHEEPEGLAPMIGTYDMTLTGHIWESFVASAAIALHVRVLSGRNAHHVVEAQFKAVARALRDAVALDPRSGGIPSTKGVL